jgi:hypothetical protein
MQINKKYVLWTLGGILVLAALFALIKFAPLQASTATATPAATLSVQATPGQEGPHTVAQDPLPGQRLNLSPTIKITFDRDMDPAGTAAAFSFLGPDRKPVAGTAAWLDARTFTFAPKTALLPASDYHAVFSKAATAVDGSKLADALQLDFTTIAGLQVGQVFPVADAEDIDPQTTVTLIFNHPVVPLANQGGADRAGPAARAIARYGRQGPVGQLVGLRLPARTTPAERHPLHGTRRGRAQGHGRERARELLRLAVQYARSPDRQLRA